jgi:hypothetical protein
MIILKRDFSFVVHCSRRGSIQDAQRYGPTEGGRVAQSQPACSMSQHTFRMRLSLRMHWCYAFPRGSAETTHPGPAGIYYVTCNFLCVMVLWCYAKAILTKPGSVPDEVRPEALLPSAIPINRRHSAHGCLAHCYPCRQSRMRASPAVCRGQTVPAVRRVWAAVWYPAICSHPAANV